MNMAVEFEEEVALGISDYIKMLKRRVYHILIPAVLVFALSVLIALLLPPTYKSKAVILIEEQEIPKEFVQSTINSFADQQILIIKQRIMTLKNIMGLIEQYNIYTEDDLRRYSQTYLAEEFKAAVEVESIGADILDASTGRSAVVTIAFELSFKHRSPQKAQKVTNELVTLYLAENLRMRTEKTISTSTFLKAEADALSNRLDELDLQVAAFKEKNAGSLPGSETYNRSIIERVEQEVLANGFRIKNLQQGKLESESRLLQMSKYRPTVLPTGEAVLSDQDRLKALESELRRQQAAYSDQHPTIISLRRSIQELKDKGGVRGESDLAEELRQERSKLATLKEQYAATHPMVVQQERLIEGLVNSTGQDGVSSVAVEAEPDDPSYIMTETQIKTADTEIKFLVEKNKELQKKIDKYESLLVVAPAVEQEFLTLTRERANASAKYQDIKAKQLVAEMSQSVEAGRKGDRFTLIQPPNTPEDPISPNRPAIMFLGFVFAGAIGLGFGLLLEIIDPGIRGEQKLKQATGHQPLISIPYIYIDSELKTVDKRKWKWFFAVVIAGLLAVAFVHFFIEPLDVIWYVLSRKLGLS